MRPNENAVAIEALGQLQRKLTAIITDERMRAQARKDWVDPEVLAEIRGYETDDVPHDSVGAMVECDDIRYAIRAELGRDFDTASMRLRGDADPEEWYERGDENWDPEWPAVVDDAYVHRMAIAAMREHEERARINDPNRPSFEPCPSKDRPRSQNAPLTTDRLEWLAKGMEGK
jgi:hypothetical protein